MRNPNGFGTIKKLSGKRKRPFAVYVTKGYEMAKKVPKIDFLKDILSDDLFQQVEAEYNDYVEAAKPKAKQNQVPIGYFETRPEAMIALAEYNKNPFDIDKRNITFAEIYEILHEKEFSKMKTSARNGYEVSYKKCTSLENMKMREIKAVHMQSILDDQAGKSKSTQNVIIVLFHAIYKYCMENDICEKDYSQFVKMSETADKKDKTPFSKDEVQIVWDNINWVQTTPRKNALTGVKMVDSIIVMLYTGLRISELLELKKDDIHLEERWIDLRGTKTPSARRIVPIHKKIMPLLKTRMESCKGEFIFCGNDGSKLIYSRYVTMFFNLFLEEFKMNHTPHECRHTFATIANVSGMNKVLMKKMFGHSAKDLTEDTYTHAFIEHLVEEIDKYNL